MYAIANEPMLDYITEKIKRLESENPSLNPTEKSKMGELIRRKKELHDSSC